MNVRNGSKQSKYITSSTSYSLSALSHSLNAWFHHFETELKFDYTSELNEWCCLQNVYQKHKPFTVFFSKTTITQKVNNQIQKGIKSKFLESTALNQLTCDVNVCASECIGFDHFKRLKTCRACRNCAN